MQILQADLETARSEIQGQKTELEAALSEQDALRSELQTAEAAEEAGQLELESAQSQLDTIAAELERSRSGLEDASVQVEELQHRMDSARTRAQVLELIFVPSLTGEIFQMSEGEASLLFVQWLEVIDQTKDPVLKEKFEALLISGFDDAALTDFFIHAIESIPDALE